MRAGLPDEATQHVVAQALRLGDIRGLATAIVLLEPKDPLFVAAGETLAQRARGKRIKVSPRELTRSFLVEFRERAPEAP